jgi:hypothetical protein
MLTAPELRDVFRLDEGTGASGAALSVRAGVQSVARGALHWPLRTHAGESTGFRAGS